MPGFFFYEERAYGRLFRDAGRVAGRVVDLLVSRVLLGNVAARPLVAAAFVLFCFIIAPARASYDPGTGRWSSMSEAMAQCNSQAAYVEAQPNNGTIHWFCEDHPDASPPPGKVSGSVCLAYQTGKCNYNEYYYLGAYVPVNPCTSSNVPSGSGQFPGRILAGYSWCKSGVQDPNPGGGTVSCSMSFAPSGPPTRNQWGSWSTPGTLSASGSTCDGTGGGGHNNWKNASGQPAGDPIPPSPDVDPPKNPAPKTCGGGSCYDPTNDNFCAVADGVQVCVPGGPARGDNGGANAGTPNGNPPGACSSSASATVCAGSPTAPLPPVANVPDPPTQVVSNDTYTQANPVTGSPIVVHTTTYNSGNASSAASGPSSGQQSGDSGPASSSSSPSPGSASGGGDCGSPPVCSGDAPTCMVVTQSWLQRCGTSKSDADGDGMPDWVTKGLDGVGPPVADTPVGSVVKTETTNSSVIDESGWAGNTCPQLPTLTLLGNEMTFGDQTLFCKWLSVLRGVFLLICAFISARILAGSKS